MILISVTIGDLTLSVQIGGENEKIMRSTRPHFSVCNVAQISSYKKSWKFLYFLSQYLSNNHTSSPCCMLVILENLTSTLKSLVIKQCLYRWSLRVTYMQGYPESVVDSKQMWSHSIWHFIFCVFIYIITHVLYIIYMYQCCVRLIILHLQLCQLNLFFMVFPLIGVKSVLIISHHYHLFC